MHTIVIKCKVKFNEFTGRNMNNCAIIDIGSNTIKMTVYGEGGERITSFSDAVGIIGYINDGRLSEKGHDILISVITSMRDKAQRCGANKIFAFATASLRALRRPDEVIHEVRRATKVNIRLLSGTDEAKISFLGALTCGSLCESGVFVDMGGGSTEISLYDKDRVTASHSFSFGALSLFKHHVSNILPTKSELSSISGYVSSSLNRFKGKIARTGVSEMTVIGGTFRSFASIYADKTGERFDYDKSFVMDAARAREIYESLCELSLSDRLYMLSAVPKRIHTLLPGCAALMEISAFYGVKTISLSPAGARDGYYRMLSEKGQI